MPSALDLRLEAAYNLITGPGGPIQVGSVERFGRQLPFITNAPTNLADYVAYFAMQHGDAPDPGPAHTGLVGDGEESGLDLLLVGLVLELLDRVASVGVVARRAAEGDDCTTPRQHDPR